MEYIFNNSNNSLQKYIAGEGVRLSDKSTGGGLIAPWGTFSGFLIKGNDLYLDSTTSIIKISDFESKFDLLKIN